MIAVLRHITRSDRSLEGEEKSVPMSDIPRTTSQGKRYRRVILEAASSTAAPR
jgi:hypothetical protein